MNFSRRRSGVAPIVLYPAAGRALRGEYVMCYRQIPSEHEKSTQRQQAKHDTEREERRPQEERVERREPERREEKEPA